MDEGAQTAPPAAPAADQQQTVEIPLAAIGQAKEGDTVMFKIISRDEQGGVANVVATTGDEPDAGGTDGMAEEFKSQPPKGA
jgi:hypothetical protein